MTIGAERIEVGRVSRWRRAQLSDRREVAVPVAERSAPRWRAALDAAAPALEALAARGADLDVHVEDDLIRYTLLPDCDPGLRSEEMLRLAELIVTRTYGEPAAAWETRVCACGPTGLLCASIDRGLQVAISTLADRLGLRARSILPVFAERARRAPRAHRADNWFVTLGHTVAVVALFEGRGMRSVHVHRAPIRDAAELRQVLEREAGRLGTSIRRVVLTGQALAGGASLDAPWQVVANGVRFTGQDQLGGAGRARAGLAV